MFYEFNGFRPVAKSSFVHPQAAVTGIVILRKNCYIGPGTAIQGDWPCEPLRKTPIDQDNQPVIDSPRKGKEKN